MNLLARLRAWPWPDLGATAAVVVAGFSQIFFALIRENGDHFPQEGWFHAGVIFWVAVLPCAALLALDLGIARRAGRDGRLFRSWRAALYTLLFASLLRQAQVYYPSFFSRLEERIPLRPLALSTLALVFLLCLRSRMQVHRFAASLGLLAAALVGSHAWNTGLFWSAWRGPAVAVPASEVAWKDDPIVFIVFDELSADVLRKGERIDAERFPRFAELAGEGAWFPRVHSDHYYTLYSIPSMLSGRLAPLDGTPRLPDYLPQGYGVVGRTYYHPIYRWLRKNAREGHDYLLCGKSDDPLDHVHEIPGELLDLFLETPFSRSPFGVTPARRIHPRFLREGNPKEESVEAELEGFFSRLNARDLRGRMLFWHCPLPHAPFVFNPDGSRHGSSSTEFLGGTFSPNDRPIPPDYDLKLVRENYAKQVGFADRVLGRVIDALRREGVYERTTLIVTSDHGLRTLGAVEPRDWPQVLAGEVNRVPLLIRGPRVKAGVYGLDVQVVDVLPTLLDALGIPYDPASMEGVSAFGPPRAPRPPRLLEPRTLRPYVYDAAQDVWRLSGP